MSADEKLNTQSRRSFLLLIPITILGGMFASVASAAFRFLRPRIVNESAETWSDVAQLSELTGQSPLLKKINIDHVTGWALTKQEHQVYVLPNRDNQVLSAICPHEGCEVAWEQDSKRFSCPCHESYFSADGARLTGPARRGLDPLPRRVQDGKLQVQFQSFENNATEQIKRA
ncbi:MAG TPA: Rieske 2Fe-2S domain-containing protein [Pyrinomonadaceae bacterium]